MGSEPAGLLASGSSFSRALPVPQSGTVGVNTTERESSPVTVAGAAPAFNRLPFSDGLQAGAWGLMSPHRRRCQRSAGRHAGSGTRIYFCWDDGGAVVGAGTGTGITTGGG